MTQVALFYCGIIDDKTLNICMDSINQFIVNDNTKIFMAITSNQAAKHEELFRTKSCYKNVVHIEWIDRNTDSIKDLKKDILNMLSDCISDKHETYLSDSDALMEYYRIYKAYTAMIKYEYSKNTRFDTIVRVRPDALFCAPMLFPTFENITKESIQLRLQDILKKYTKTSDILSILIHSLYLPNRVTTTRPADFLTHSLEEIDKLVDIKNIESMIQYLKYGKFVLTIGKNLLFMTKRHHFTFLAALGITYGQYYLPEFKQWLDPPYQFQISALMNGFTIFDSITKDELDVIKNYDPSKVTDENGFMFIAS